MASSNPSTDLQNLFGVEGLVVVITGGGSGLGAMMAGALENNGATVYILGRRKESLEKTIAERARHGRMYAIQADVTDRDTLKAAAAHVREKHDHIDLLVNNSGVMTGDISAGHSHGGDIRKLQDALWDGHSPEDFAKMFEVNVTGAYWSTVAFLDLLAAANNGKDLSATMSQVITVSSIAGFRRDGKIGSIGYCLSKSAATHLGRLLVGTLKDFKIRSNIIAPGLFPSEMTVDKMDPVFIREGIALQRTGTEEDMTGLILYLAGRSGAYVDGTTFAPDGGRISTIPSFF
ncbi:unnamed protein product [Peniophora sp. CBMAI 1063]|nr:unnamed protein product [Peniophora sp. CBMAI 1063]